MKKLLVGLILTISQFLNAQTVEEMDTKILDGVSGEPLFTLLQGQSMFSYEPTQGWYKVRKKVRLKIVDVEGNIIIKGALLQNEKKENIGHTIQEVKVEEIKKVEEFRGDGWYEAIVEGYLFKTKIEKGSIPEVALEKIFSIKNKNEQAEAFDDFKRNFKFEERKFGEFTAFVLREENKVLAEEKDFRLIVVFRNRNTVFAVLTNNHTVELQKVKQKWEEGDFSVQYLTKPSENQKEEVENILYTFLAL